MVYNDITTKDGVIQDCEMNVFGNYGDITSSADRLYDFTARINRAYDKISAIAMGVDKGWRFDDANYTDFPVGSTALVSGQADYTMSVEYLDILKVLVLDSSGNKIILQPFDLDDSVGDMFLEQITSTSGIPTHYRRAGGSLFLYPTPNYSKAAGLIIYHQRKPSYFVYTDTTKSVGLPSIFHRYLSIEASLDYAIDHRMDVKNDLAVRVKEFEAQFEDFISKRSKDSSKFIIGVNRSSR